MPAMHGRSPLRHRLDLYGLSELIRCLRRLVPHGIEMAEIGCFLGESTRQFARACRTVHAVDHWKPFPHDDALSRQIEDAFDAHLAGCENVRKWKMSSAEAARAIPDGSLDFVYIDADHAYESAAEDIALWLPKLKPEGWMGGHDFNAAHWPGVVRAVRERFGEPPLLFADTSWLAPRTPQAIPFSLRMRGRWNRMLYAARAALRPLLAAVSAGAPREQAAIR